MFNIGVFYAIIKIKVINVHFCNDALRKLLLKYIPICELLKYNIFIGESQKYSCEIQN